MNHKKLVVALALIATALILTHLRRQMRQRLPPIFRLKAVH